MLLNNIHSDNSQFIFTQSVHYELLQFSMSPHSWKYLNYTISKIQSFEILKVVSSIPV